MENALEREKEEEEVIIDIASGKQANAINGQANIRMTAWQTPTNAEAKPELPEADSTAHLEMPEGTWV